MKKSLIACAIATALPMLSEAAPPIPFGQGWTYDNATRQIAHTCPADTFTPPGGAAQARYSCSSTPVTDNNFMQIEITDRQTGQTYFRTIIADSTAAGATSPERFVTESFVQVQNSATGGTSAGSGIAASQQIDSRLNNSGVLTSNTTILTGGFNNGTTENTVNLRQDVWNDGSTNPEFHAGFGFTRNPNAADQNAVARTTLDQQIRTAAGTDPFADSFRFEQTRNATDVITGTRMDILTGIALNGTAQTNLGDQLFVYTKADGTFVTGSGTATMPGQTPPMNWVPGNSLEQVIVNQSVDAAGMFGYERLANNTPANARTLTMFSLGSLAPFSTITPAPGDPNPFPPIGNPGLVTVTGPGVFAPL